MDKNEDLAGHNLLITRSKAHFRVIAGSYETKSISFCKKMIEIRNMDFFTRPTKMENI